MLKTEVICADTGPRLDVWVCGQFPELSRSYAQKLIDDGLITVNGKSAKPGAKLKAGDRVSLDVPEPETLSVKAENIGLDVVYEDDDLMVIDKPKGMVVHPAAGNISGTLVNALMAYCGDSLSDINGVIRPGIVHRIDKDTSGLIVVAKNNFAHAGLSEALKTHDIKRTYIAIAEGAINAPAGTVDAPIARHPTNRKQMAVVHDGRRAVTHFKVLSLLRGATYLELELETGRTHQIRVHLAYIGHPIVGDPLYNKGKKHPGLVTDGQALHARALDFRHPRTGERMRFDTGVPEYFQKILGYFS